MTHLTIDEILVRRLSDVEVKKLTWAMKSAGDELDFELNNIKGVIPMYERDEE